ncbi:MAG TPA: arsenical pump-driving ATPase [Paenibacillus sp.]|nr:arsenical pump-driving ATPase [Paenibacillus taichungensis]HBU82420.1 arsenical pump-driving ATPase [Paenibacillus sp.]
MLVSTDPASNLQDVFGMEFSNYPIPVMGMNNLDAANLDPETAANEYKAEVVEPYRGVLPDTVIATMEEQLSGACTVEIAAFNEFSSMLTNQELREQYDHILFDTAPTGHTLRLLQLPTAWSGFLSESTHGASCLGPLAGLEAKKTLYQDAVKTLSNENETTLMLVTRPEDSPLKEAARASQELREIGIQNQLLIVNGLHASVLEQDIVSSSFHSRQVRALEKLPVFVQQLPIYQIPLAPFNITGIEHLRHFFDAPEVRLVQEKNLNPSLVVPLQHLIDDMENTGIRVIFTMGKGGVGKTTVASAIAVGLAERGHRVHLSTTDPASHLSHVLEQETDNITTSCIDPKVELERYKKEVLAQNKDSLDEDGLAYLEEDLRSPCTEEIAVFRAFANLVERSGDEIVVIDTAPTGHTLLLLDATEEYHKEISRSAGVIPAAVQHLLPRLRDPNETSVVIVTLAEATPYYEAFRLEQDLQRASIPTKWWTINQSFAVTDTTDPILSGRAIAEQEWIQLIHKASEGNIVIIPWESKDVVGYDNLKFWTEVSPSEV